jgi:hypothetical protein
MRGHASLFPAACSMLRALGNASVSVQIKCATAICKCTYSISDQTEGCCMKMWSHMQQQGQGGGTLSSCLILAMQANTVRTRTVPRRLLAGCGVAGQSQSVSQLDPLISDLDPQPPQVRSSQIRCLSATRASIALPPRPRVESPCMSREGCGSSSPWLHAYASLF